MRIERGMYWWFVIFAVVSVIIYDNTITFAIMLLISQMWAMLELLRDNIRELKNED